MYIAAKLKEDNIAEYVLYMWHTEDIIRAYDCDVDRIAREYVPRFGLDKAHSDALVAWYADLCRMMRSEGVKERGHLQINKNVVAELSELSARLLESHDYPRYRTAYNHALPVIMALRQKGSGTMLSDIEVCLGALYGVMVLRMQKKPISEGTETGIKDISAVIALLAAYYKENKKSPLKFDSDF